jgi:glycosyltransferase involved in cell wall biosynthesis
MSPGTDLLTAAKPPRSSLVDFLRRKARAWAPALSYRILRQAELETDSDGRLVSTGVDPQIFIQLTEREQVPRWLRIRFRVQQVNTPLNPMLYAFASGEGNRWVEYRLPSIENGVLDEIVLVPPGMNMLRLDPTNGPAVFRLTDLTLHEVGRGELLVEAWSTDRRAVLRALGHRLLRRRNRSRKFLMRAFDARRSGRGYEEWLSLFDQAGSAPFLPAHQASGAAATGTGPLISIVMPVFNPPERFLREAIRSVLAQTHQNWELVMSDDGSTERSVARVMAWAAHLDPRIRVIRSETQGGISTATNLAMVAVKGDYVAFMDHDDLLPPGSLATVAAEIQAHPGARLIYSDEDKVDDLGNRYDPFFKPEFDPDILLGQNMLNHLCVIHRQTLAEVGPLRSSLDGSQDHDLLLRVMRRIDRSAVRHIPEILYHWRRSRKPRSFSQQQQQQVVRARMAAVREHLKAVVPGAKADLAMAGYIRIIWPLPDPAPKVSIIVPTRDRVALLRPCVESILAKTVYPDFEVIIVDNASTDPETLNFLASVSANARVRVLRHPGPFNFSEINNVAARQATGELLCFVNNDIEVTDGDWLREMASHGVRPDVGAVGAKLLYPDGHIQHAGVVVGLGGVAGHAFKSLVRNHPGYFGRLCVTHEVGAVTAACMLTKASSFWQVGGFDAENLAVAFNDVDYCLKLREAGQRIIMTPFACLIHAESASRGPDTEGPALQRFQGEIAYMQDRWADTLLADPFYSPNLSLVGHGYTLAFPPRRGART